MQTKVGDIQKNHYDAEGLRSQMEENGKLVSFVYADREVITEEDKAGAHIRYIRGHELLASDSERARTYYHYACDEMMDAVTGQYYLRARFYNPVIARFLSEDTYYGDGLNLYAYCHNNPVGYVDPSGHICEKKYNAVESLREQDGSNAADALKKYKELREQGYTPEQIKNGDYKKSRYSKNYYEGTTKVGGQINDISRTVYQRNDIDWNRVDPATGLTNKQLAQAGSAPYANDGTKMELHHLLQQEPGPMVEIPASLHDKYYKTLHGLVGDGESFRNNPRLEKQYNNFRAKYWRWRAKNL